MIEAYVIEKPNYFATKEFYYRNAIGVFGIVPVFALLNEYKKANQDHEVSLIEKVLISFRDDPKFRAKVSANQLTFNKGKLVCMSSISIIDLALTDLGYYEKYDFKKLESDMIEIVKFVNAGFIG